MAAIGEIRKRSGLLVIMIGGALVLFILNDLIGGNNGPDQLNVGEINGQSIDNVEFERRVQSQIEFYGQGRLNSQQTDQLRDQVWENMIRDYTLGREVNAVGLSVGTEEFKDMIGGENISALARGDFGNPQTGEYDVQNSLQIIQSIQATVGWNNRKEMYKRERAYEKYNILVSKGLYKTTFELEQELALEKKTAKINYIVKRYNEVPDSLVSFTDADLKNYLTAHSDEPAYQQDDLRKLTYVTFKVEASEQDITDIKEKLGDLKTNFMEAEDDSAFVASKRGTPFEQSYTPGADETINNMFATCDSGAVLGPYVDGSSARLVKVTTVNKDSISSVQARHILVKWKNGGADPDADSTEVRNRIADIKKRVDAGEDFATLATENSEDGSASQGGDLGFFTRGRMVPQFEEYSFENAVGDVGVVETQYGVHIIKVEKQVPVINYYAIDRPIVASRGTKEEIFEKANNFAVINETQDLFNKAVEADETLSTIDVSVFKSTKAVNGIPNSIKVVRWAFENEVGAVSDAEEFENQIMVACLTGRVDKGTTDIEQVRPTLEAAVKKREESRIHQRNAFWKYSRRNGY